MPIRLRSAILLGLCTLCTLGCQPGLRADAGVPGLPADRLVGEELPRLCALAAVVDGDTLALVCNGEPVRVRLHCIDAPELGQGPWGRASRDHLASQAPRTLILVPVPTEHGYRDRFGRVVGEVLTPDQDRRNLGMAQVLTGQAVVYPKYCNDERYVWVEGVARQARIGVWRSPGRQQTPWVWRHQG
jgi:endonuclease YncB( thermonuclease family)